MEPELNMKNHEIELPDLAKALGPSFRNVDPGDRPLLLAVLERLAARRYRIWASEHSDPEVQAGLLACADREEEIARRAESLYPNAAESQDRLLAENPELLELSRTLFEGRPLKDQFTMQAQGEQAGAAAWRAQAAAAADPAAQELLQSCSPLEEANAAFLQSLL